ncbi:MAG TPA: zf-HC2 domain-containing protein [Acidimicrobiales bacterium]
MTAVSAWPPPPPPEHPEELLSAYLDGEVTADERAYVEEHLTTCSTCRAEFEEERDVRAAVRSLPPVDPPFGFFERVLREGPTDPAEPKKRRFKFGMANLVATAAAWILVLGVANLNSHGGSVNPEANGYVTAHASVLPSFGTASGGSKEAKRYDVPDRLAGTYQLVDEVDTDGFPQLIYSDGQKTLSVFVRPGHLNTNALPDDAKPVQVNGSMAWEVPSGDTEVIFLQRPGAVVVIVGAGQDAAASDMASTAPRADGDDSILDHLRGAGEGLLETFGFQG